MKQQILSVSKDSRIKNLDLDSVKVKVIKYTGNYYNPVITMLNSINEIPAELLIDSDIYADKVAIIESCKYDWCIRIEKWYSSNN